MLQQLLTAPPAKRGKEGSTAAATTAAAAAASAAAASGGGGDDDDDDDDDDLVAQPVHAHARARAPGVAEALLLSQLLESRKVRGHVRRRRLRDHVMLVHGVKGGRGDVTAVFAEGVREEQFAPQQRKLQARQLLARRDELERREEGGGGYGCPC